MIKVENLTKKYAGVTAVDDITFTAEPGRVTGFLGPNGAGKSTTMRIMVGLTPASSGTATISGHRYAELPNPGLDVGVLLDASAQHAGRTGREILTLAQRTMGLPARTVDEMLDRVSLTRKESERRVRNYSLGMRQRLGIATALIGDPAVLILDEPANGLDPAGIRWMRDLLRDYADRGGTVLLSSHLLHEIEVVADDIVVIGHGRIVAQGTKFDLLRSAGTIVKRRRPGPPRHRPRGGGPAGHRRRGRPPGRRRPGSRRPGRPPHRRTPDRAARRRRRAGGDVPRAHRRHPARRPHPHHPGRSSGMSATATALPPPTVPARVARSVTPHPPIPMTRIIGVELRKMFDTRSGFWLMASIVIANLLATGAVILFAGESDQTYGSYAASIGFPMAIILPMIAVLSVTSEWSQRSGLTTFTLVPNRGRVILAKGIGAVLVGVVSMGIAFAVGALGNLLGTAITGNDLVWDMPLTLCATIVLGNVLGLLVGFMLGVVIRNSAGAIVGYFVYSFVLPTLSMLLAQSQDWFEKLQPWVDFNFAQSRLFDTGMTSENWAQLGVSSIIWLVVPLAVGLALLMRSEVK